MPGMAISVVFVKAVPRMVQKKVCWSTATFLKLAICFLKVKTQSYSKTQFYSKLAFCLYCAPWDHSKSAKT